jgi:hypothetical protein
MFGFLPRWTLKQIETGRLVAKKKAGLYSADQEVDEQTKYAIAPKAVTRFMRDHPAHWDHRRMNKAVLLDLLLGQYNGGKDDD